jgi:hypothetical protein
MGSELVRRVRWTHERRHSIAIHSVAWETRARRARPSASVPVILARKGRATNLQNELPPGGELSGRRGDAGAIGEVAAERHDGRYYAERRDEARGLRTRSGRILPSFGNSIAVLADRSWWRRPCACAGGSVRGLPEIIKADNQEFKEPSRVRLNASLTAMENMPCRGVQIMTSRYFYFVPSAMRSGGVEFENS